ncbi:MAG: hypothetical protein J7M25_10160 [Deltaproteobacteria bacterium]|nr:hypothetical protein [Deltaproteobacteria bacterium]
MAKKRRRGALFGKLVDRVGSLDVPSVGELPGMVRRILTGGVQAGSPHRASDLRSSREADRDRSGSEAAASAASSEGEQEMVAQVDLLKGQLEETKLALLGQTTKLKNEVHDLKKRNSELLEKVVYLTQKERNLSQQILDAQFSGSGHRADKKKLEVDMADLRREVKRAEARAKKADETLQHQTAELTQLREELEQARVRAAERAGRVQEEDAWRRQVMRLEKDLAASKKQAFDLERKLGEARASVRPTVEQGRVGRQRAAKAGGELSSLHTAVRELQRSVLELRSAVDEGAEVAAQVSDDSGKAEAGRPRSRKNPRSSS